MNLAMQARLTLVLMGACGVFALLAMAFWAGLGNGYDFLPPKPDDARPLPSLASVQQQDFNMPGFTHYVEINQRPLFSLDRRPIPPQQKQEEMKPAEPPVPLQVKLTGVIITPEVKLVLLHDKTTNKDVSLREGMPLPGKQAAWSLVEVSPRNAVFKNAQDETKSLSLTVAETSGVPALQVVPAPNGENQNAGKPEAGQNDSQEDLRQRIEERRKQLREQARQIREQRLEARKNPQEKTR